MYQTLKDELGEETARQYIGERYISMERFFDIEPPFVVESASAPRMIIRFDPEPKGYMMLITGDNEYFLSPHRTDMTDAWLQREYFCMEEELPKYTMVMMPGG